MSGVPQDRQGAPGQEQPPGDRRADPGRLFLAGLQRHRAGKLADARRNYALCLGLDPTHADAWINLGVLYRATGRFDAAVAALRRGVALRPEDAAAWSNLGNALRAAGRLDEAKTAHLTAVDRAPGTPSAHYNLGIALKDLGELEAAAHCYRRAALLGHDSPELAWDQALLTLLSGAFEAGFDAYEARWRLAESPPRHTDLPRWDGAPPGDGAVLLHAEQGQGDTLQFLRYVPAALARAGSVVLEVQSSLKSLAEAAFAGPTCHVVARGTARTDVVAECPLLSLPRLLGTEPVLGPGATPYLPHPGGPRLRRVAGRPIVALVWAGKPSHRNDRNRSIPLELLAPIIEIPDVDVISLQVGPARERIAALGFDVLLRDVGGRVTDFADTASLLRDVDLVITVDTAMAHLAGALGRPAWVLLPFAPDWRWQLLRQDSPWYPSLTLFRQTSPGDWPELVARLRADLKRWLRDHTKK